MTDGAQGPPPGPRVAAALATLFGVTGLGSAAVAVSLPVLTDSLQVSPGRAALVVSCYALSLAVGSALMGRLGDRYGIRAPLVAGLIVMVVAACIGASVDSLPALVAARIVQGLGASAVPALTLAAVHARFAGDARDQAMATYSGVGATVNALGPVVGAMIVGPLGWRPVVAIPVASLLVLPLVWDALPATPQPGSRLDIPGAALVGVAATGAILSLQFATLGPTVALAGLAALAVAAPWAVLRVRSHPDGVVSAALVRDRVARRSLVTAVSLSSAWFGMLVAIPTRLAAAGWSGVQIGLLLVPSAALGLVASRITSPGLARLGLVRSQLVALTGSALALLLAAVGTATLSAPPLVLATLTLMLSFGLGQPAMTGLVADAVPARSRGGALGLLTVFFLAGGSLGSATVGGLAGEIGTTRALLALAVIPALGALAFVGPSRALDRAEGRP